WWLLIVDGSTFFPPTVTFVMSTSPLAGGASSVCAFVGFFTGLSVLPTPSWPSSLLPVVGVPGCPSWPSSFDPHVHAWPLLSSATTKLPPALICVTCDTPVSFFGGTGKDSPMLWSTACPSVSEPRLPHVHT